MKRNKPMQTIGKVLGGIALALSAMIIIPYVIDTISSYAYKKQKKEVSINEDDWGPEIVKKESEEINNGI